MGAAIPADNGGEGSSGGGRRRRPAESALQRPTPHLAAQSTTRIGYWSSSQPWESQWLGGCASRPLRCLQGVSAVTAQLLQFRCLRGDAAGGAGRARGLTASSRLV